MSKPKFVGNFTLSVIIGGDFFFDEIYNAGMGAKMLFAEKGIKLRL